MRHLALVKRALSFSVVMSVYAIAVMFVYGWTIYWFLWNLPSWLHYLTFQEIFLLAAYSLSANFLESLILLSLPVLVAFLLPRGWFSEHFIAAGVLLVTFTGGLLMYYAPFFLAQQQFMYGPFLWALVFLGASIVAAAFLSKLKFIERPVTFFAEQAKIFLYLIIPMSIASIFIVIFQNLS